DLGVGGDLARGLLDLLDDLATALSTPRFRSIGFMPAATDFRPSVTMAWASTVAVVVAQAIVTEGLKSVAAGMNPMDLKRGVDKAVARSSRRSRSPRARSPPTPRS